MPIGLSCFDIKLEVTFAMQPDLFGVFVTVMIGPSRVDLDRD